MHAYSGGYSHTITHVFLGSLAFALDAVILKHALPQVHCDPFRDPVGLAVAGFIILFVLLEVLYTSRGWRVLQWADGSDFAGFYEECALAGHADNTPAHPATLKIKQTCNRMSITMRHGGAIYKSISAAIVKNQQEKGDVDIVFTYFCTGAHHGAEREGAHFGTFILKRQEFGRRLEGIYFTESKRANYDRLSFKRMSRLSV